jgi:CheY-like chemotaxis protein
MMRVLLIDDDTDDATLFKEALGEIGLEVHFEHFDDPKEALRHLLRTTDKLPYLNFLDINMPIISGGECLSQFKKTEHLKEIPVIMYTTSSQAREKQMAGDLGAAGYITKHDYFKLKELLSTLIQGRFQKLNDTISRCSFIL